MYISNLVSIGRSIECILYLIESSIGKYNRLQYLDTPFNNPNLNKTSLQFGNAVQNVRAPTPSGRADIKVKVNNARPKTTYPATSFIT